MSPFEIIPARSPEGFESFESFEQYEDEDSFEHERGRGGARARPPSRRAAPSRSRAKRPMRRGKPRPKLGAKPGSKLGAKPRPKPGAKPGLKMGPKPRPMPGPKPGPRPRPRPGPRPGPRPLPGIGLPWLVERIGGGGAAMPSGDGPSGAAGDDDRWRCVQACFSRASGDASAAAAAPEPDTGNGKKSNGNGNGNGSKGSDAKGGDADGGDAQGSNSGDDTAPEPASEEFEFGNEYEGYVGYDSEFEAAPGLLTLSAAIADPRAAGPGIYTLFKEGQRVYVGRSDNLRRRLQQHLLCLTHLKLKPSRFHVKLTPLRDSTAGHRSRVESAVIGRYGRTKQGGQLANVKSREFGY